MESSARHRLRQKFSAISPGTRFQLVNNVMGAAVPGTPVFEKLGPESEFPIAGSPDDNARNVATGEGVRVRATQEVELLG